MSGLGSGIVNLFKGWGRGIGNAADKFLLSSDARKAISDEVISKYKPKIDRVHTAESRRANNIKDLGEKVTQSKKDLADARANWQQNYDSALTSAKNKRQTDIADYEKELQGYKDALANAKAGRNSILDQLRDKEAVYDPSRTIFTDVTTGNKYIFNPIKNEYRSLDSLTEKEQHRILKHYSDYDTRLIDDKGNVINAFDDSNIKSYTGNQWFDGYSNRIKAQNTNLRDAENEIIRAKGDLRTWGKNNSRPADWDDTKDLSNFETDFEKINGAKPKKYSFNGRNYKSKSDLEAAYNRALNREQRDLGRYKTIVSDYASKRDAEIAKRIQDAKDIKKAKLALGAGALAAGAAAMYGGDDTDTGDTNNIDNTDNTYTGEPDPDFNVEKEGQAILNDRQQIDTDFDPDKAEAEAVLAGAAYDEGVEDGNSIRSSGDLGNNIGASTRGHTMDDRLYELIKAMKDPYKANAVANYIYSRHGDDPEVQNLGWRGWLNKYYGDSLRSILNIDPSGYKGMHIA